MGSTLAIGDFSRATHLSVKTLRHYHQIGLLEPIDVDPVSGYRRYATEQISTAQVIRRFRDLDMPLDEIHAVLDASEPQVRGRLISAHLARMEADLRRTQEAVSSLRELLEHPSAAAHIRHRRVEATSAATISEVVDLADALLWHHGALGELHSALAAQGVATTGPGGGIFSTELFTEERGLSTVFMPIREPLRPLGRITAVVVSGIELATTVHNGPHAGIDRAYGSLATYVTHHALAIDGPIREYFLVGPTDTTDQSAWRTEIGWPIFDTAAGDRPG